VHSC